MMDDERVEELKLQIKKLQLDEEFYRLCTRQIQDKLLELYSELDDLLENE